MMYHKKARLISVVSLASIILSVIMCAIAMAKDYSTPHTFHDGDIISADVFNELFHYIDNSMNSITEESILGTWNCDGYSSSLNCNKENPPTVPGWELDSTGFICLLPGSSFTFSNSGSGNYTISTSSPNPFSYYHESSVTSPYKIIGGDTLVFHYDVSVTDTPSYTVPWYSIKKKSSTRLALTALMAGGQGPRLILCDKQQLPPNEPLSLSASTVDNGVSLNWVDNSSDEKGFKIFRKDSLANEYVEIAAVDVDKTGYRDDLKAAGEYWYRVKATNEHGDSLGSNVIKVTINQ
jgi:hypothetical protein